MKFHALRALRHLDGVGYFAVIASLLLMKLDPEPVRKASTSRLVRLKEGWAYVSAPGPIRTVMIMFAIFSFMGVPSAVLMPVFATKVLHGGPHPLGWLMAGKVSPVLGAPRTFVVCGLGCAAGGIWFWLQLAKLRPALRPIYEQIGVLPAKG